MSAITLSCGLRDLYSFKLLIESGNNTRKIYHLVNKKDFWEIGEKYMINPSYKKIYVSDLYNKKKVLFSNESALANLSMLNPPKKEMYAIDKKNMSSLEYYQTIDEEDAENENCYTIELWKYDSLFLSQDRKNVDKYFLYS